MDAASISKKKKEMHLLFHGVKIFPKFLLFNNAYDGKKFKEKIDFQNISSKSVRITTKFPTSTSFKVNSCLRDVHVSSGLHISLYVSYTYKHGAVTQTQLPVYVNNHLLTYDIFAMVSSGHIFSKPRVVQFGHVNIGNFLHVQSLNLYNKGYKATKFEFDLADNELDLMIRPSKGFIPARGVTEVEFNFIASKEGQFYKEIWIKCEDPFRITLVMNVIQPQLIVTHPLKFTDTITPVIFPPIYDSCKSEQCVQIENYNTLKTMFLIVPEFKHNVVNFDKAETLEPMYKSFSLSPVDGFLEPDELCNIKISFEPRSIDNAQKERIYFVFYRVLRLESLNVEKMIKAQTKVRRETIFDSISDYEMVTKISSHSKSSLLSLERQASRAQFITGKLAQCYSGRSNRGSQAEVSEYPSIPGFIRLCLFAVVKPVQVAVQPTNFDIGTMVIETSVMLSLSLYNNSHDLPIYFRYKKSPFIEAEPDFGFIDRNKNAQIKITLLPRAPGHLEYLVTFEMLYYNQLLNKSKEFGVVGMIQVPVTVNVILETKKPRPKFNMGITPQITNEVGILPDGIRFSEEITKPRMAMLKCCPKKMLDLMGDALIAFPNDRPKSLRPWRNKEKCKTIFAHLSRTIALNDKYNRTSSEELRKLNNDSYYSKYINDLRIKRLKDVKTTTECDYNNFELKCFPLHVVPSLKNIPKPILPPYTALTPVQIYFIKISPASIKLGKVMVNSVSFFNLLVENNNLIPIRINLDVYDLGENCVFTNLIKEFVIEGREKKIIEIEFNPSIVQRYNTIINAYYNNQHIYPIVFSADVVQPSVTLDTNQIVFDETNPTSQQVKLYNSLNTVIQFTWEVPESCCFTVVPITGSIPKYRNILCTVEYHPDFVKRNSATLGIKCTDGTSVQINVTACFENNDVIILTKKMTISNIPLNLLTTKTNTLRNNSFENILFCIRNPKPIYGVSIEPLNGVIHPRSETDLTISIFMEMVVTFACKVDVEFEHGKKITFQINGSIELPDISFSPDTINFRRVPAESFDVSPFRIQNQGKGLVHLKFLKEIFPEIIVSTSSDMGVRYSENVNLVLQGGEIATLYLHFIPLDVCMHQFYLPVVINNIIGPATKDQKLSLLPQIYLEKFHTQYMDELIDFVPYSTKLKALTVSTISTRHVLRFSKTYVNFKYFPNDHYRSNVNCELKIINEFRGTIEFCICIDDTHPNFDLSHKSGGTIELLERFLLFKANQSEEITLTASFCPTSPGDYNVYLPIYVKEILDGNVFNYLHLSGLYPHPEFECPRWVHLEPVTTGVIIVQNVKLTLLYHESDCVVKINSKMENVLNVEIVKDNLKYKEDLIKRDFNLKVEFRSFVPISFYTLVTIQCTCGGIFIMIVTAAAEDSTVTTYSHRYLDSSYKNVVLSRDFGIFPNDADTTDFAIYMRRIAHCVEKWLFQQVFYMGYYHFIPKSFYGTYNNDNQKEFTDIPIITKVLFNIAGKVISPYLLTKNSPKEELERIHYFHTVYTNTLKFIKAQGGVMPHVQPRYLLSYQEYVTYMTVVRKEKLKKVFTPLDEATFQARSKKCWLDVLLQIFKSMILPSVLSKRRKISRIEILSTKVEPTISKDSENALLRWLTTNFNRHREDIPNLDIHKPKHFTLQQRNITNFTVHLADSLVLIAVTLEYCPYLAPYLTNIYVDVDTETKALHNAAELIASWKMIHCSFIIMPNEITHPVAVQMLMLVSYMYDVFPNLTPKDELRFSTYLSRIQEKELHIKNPNNVEVHYLVKFLDNDMNCFTISNAGTLKIKPGNTTKLTVQYQAKKLSLVKATVLFCGDTPEQTYCKSVVYTLIGEPSFQDDDLNVTVLIDLYTITEKTIMINAPYQQVGTYDISFTHTKPIHWKCMSMNPWRVNREMLKPRLIISDEQILEVDETGIGSLNVIVCCLSVKIIEIWTLFSCKEIGDFLVKITIEPLTSNAIERTSLFLEVSEDWLKTPCPCKTNHLINPDKCPRRLKLNIPSRNDQFWDVVVESFLHTVPLSEKELWKEFAESEMAPLLFNWLLDNRELIVAEIFQSSVTYQVFNDNDFIILPSKIKINNIRAVNFNEIPIHVDEGLTEFKKPPEFHLLSEDGSEIRLYRIILQISHQNYENHKNVIDE